MSKTKYNFGRAYFDKALRDKYMTAFFFNLFGEPEGPKKDKAYLTIKRTTPNDVYVIRMFKDKWLSEIDGDDNEQA